MSTNKENQGNAPFHLGEFLTRYSMVIALVIVFILFYFLTDGRLLYAQNMSNLLLQNGYVLVMACGMLLCILTGGNIDLSVGSVICMVGGVAAVMITNHGFNIYLTILICLAIGVLAGVWQGYWIGYVRIPPFITTLGGMFVFRGFGRLVLDSKTVSVQDPAFLNIFTAYIKIPGLDTDTRILSPLVIGALVVVFIFYSTISSRANKAKKGYRQNSALTDFGRSGLISAALLAYCYLLSQYKGVSVMLLWVVVICLIYHFITSKTAFGRYFYAVGGNVEAAKLSGIRVGRIKYLVFALSGFFAGLAGLVILSRTNSGMANAGDGYEFDVITCVVLGGVSVTGGYGKMSGVVAGTFIIGALKNGMVLMNINSYVQNIVMGVVLALAVGFDCIQKKNQSN